MGCESAPADDWFPVDEQSARAPVGTQMNTADSAWMLISTALVLFMVPGLALFYGGLVAEKNVIAMMTQSFVAIGIVTVLWVVIGYPLVFGVDHHGLHRWTSPGAAARG